MTDDTSGHGTVDPGKLNVILAAVESGWRERTFTIPPELRPSRREIEALPVNQRRVLIEPRLALRREIDRAKSRFRNSFDLNRTPWSAIAVRGKEIKRKVKSLSKLFTKDAAGKTWARQLPEVAALWVKQRPEDVPLFSRVDAEIAKQLDGQTVIGELDQSALDGFVFDLAAVFKVHLKEEAKRACLVGPDGDEIYGPFVTFVLEVAKEDNISIKPATIHRIMTAGRGMGRRVEKK